MFAPSPAPARPPTGELALDIADPVVAATIAGVPLRLRVELDQGDVVLNPAAAAKLPIAWHRGSAVRIGRIALPGIGASVRTEIAGRTFIARLSSHDRDCCAGVDGSIGPLLLPYARLRFVRNGVPPDPEVVTLTMRDSDEGLRQVDPQEPKLRIQFSLDRPESTVSASAGAVLASAHRGRFEGGYDDRPIAFGVSRPTRMMTFANQPVIAGFRFDSLRVRIADFGGHLALPRDPARPGDIVVSKRLRSQPADPIVLIGRDRLDRCSEIVFDAPALRLDLRCRFE